MTLLGTQILELQSDWIKVSKDSERMWKEAVVPQGPHIFLNSDIHLKIVGAQITAFQSD